MLDIKFIRENPEIVKEGMRSKQLKGDLVDDLLRFDEERRKLLQETETLKAQQNKLGKENREKAVKIKEKLKTHEPRLKEIEKSFNDLIFQIPNLPAPDVRVGKDESENRVLRKWGEPKEFSFVPKNHLELGQNLGLIDVERAAKVSGARFGYLINEGVLLEFALVTHALKTLIKEGFLPIIPPALIKKEITEGLGYWQHGGHEDYYWVLEPSEETKGYYLVGTAEHSIVPYYKDEIIEASALPIRYVAFSSCFRREAGSYGKDTKGILRVHQFDKVEMVSFTKSEDHDKEEHEYLLSLEEKLLQSLDIPYQVVKMCTGDLGLPAARKYDLEAWLPGQGKYRELTSTSTTTDFQARRLNIKYRDGKETRYVHILNGTAFAIGRTIIAILENYQNADGSVAIPEVLRSYVGKDKIEPRA